MPIVIVSTFSMWPHIFFFFCWIFFCIVYHRAPPHRILYFITFESTIPKKVTNQPWINSFVICSFHSSITSPVCARAMCLLKHMLKAKHEEEKRNGKKWELKRTRGTEWLRMASVFEKKKKKNHKTLLYLPFLVFYFIIYEITVFILIFLFFSLLVMRLPLSVRNASFAETMTHTHAACNQQAHTQ